MSTKASQVVSRRPKLKSSSTQRPKITAAVRQWLSANGRLGGLATNVKRAKAAA
jgi:hypothetical protein